MLFAHRLKSILKLSLALLLTTSAASAQTFTKENPPGRDLPGLDLSAYEVFYSMYDQSINLSGRAGDELYVIGTNRTIPVTFGAEKEGSSSKVLRIMSPNKEYFAKSLANDPSLALWFVKNFIHGNIRQRSPVLDQDGKVIELDSHFIQRMQEIDWSIFEKLTSPIADNASEDELDARDSLHRKLEMYLRILEFVFPESPFSFLTKAARQKLWSSPDPDIPGERLFGKYDHWIPLYGEAEKYIQQGHKELNNGWEVIFKPQKTYADFEKQILWFRTLMGSKTKLFESPGHSRVVMPRVALAPDQVRTFEGKAAELNRMLLAYIVLRGIKGNTGLLGAKHKAIPSEENLKDLKSGRGPIRLELDRFYKNSIGVEFRTGMKDETLRRFAHAVYTSRLATNDMNDLSSINDWKLLPQLVKTSSWWSEIVFYPEEYGVTQDQLDRAIKNFESVQKRHDRAYLSREYMLPLWTWWNAPFAKGKQAELTRLSYEFIVRLSEMQNPSYQQINRMMVDWATASNLIADVEYYMTPKKPIDRVSSPLLINVKPGDLDVNKIDLGNEFTARMPLKLKAAYDGNGTWVQTIQDMTPDEREARIKSVAETLQENFTGSREGVTRLSSGSHGHSLSIAYELKDKLNRTWRVEWDGVSRNYDLEGKILESTARGGHIEIVSPKYNPSMQEILAVYEMMEKESLVPDYKMGGSHINIDFEVFERNPKAMARFLTIFHQNRGIISFMFQHINRLRSAEPVEITPAFEAALKTFNGTQEDLAKLLYNNKYFNSRQNRKTRYTQIDVSNFMGNVIPEEFIKPDFDVVKARFTGGDGWSRQFRVTKHKKLEFRLFDAAKDPLEAALQIKVVRAMMNLAINSDVPLTRKAQTVDHEAYVKNPQKAYDDLRTLVRELGLTYADYSPYVTNKIVINGGFMRGKFYKNWFVRADQEFPKTSGWGEALLRARTKDKMFYSDSIRKPTPPAPAPLCRRVLL